MQVRLLELLARIKKIQEERDLLRKNMMLEVLKALKREAEDLRQEKKELSLTLAKQKVFKAHELQYLLSLRDNFLDLEKVAEEKIKDCERELNQIEELLLQRHKERKLFEKLREKVISRTFEEESKKAYRELDEIALLRRSRGS